MRSAGSAYSDKAVLAIPGATSGLSLPSTLSLCTAFTWRIDSSAAEVPVADAWATLHSDTSRPFDKPKSGRIAVKVINRLGDEVMKVFKVT